MSTDAPLEIPNDPAIVAKARQDLDAAALTDEVHEALESSPPIRPEQAVEIADLLLHGAQTESGSDGPELLVKAGCGCGHIIYSSPETLENSRPTCQVCGLVFRTGGRPSGAESSNRLPVPPE